MYIYAIDGDDIGRQFERLLLSEGIDAAKAYSNKVQESIGLLTMHLIGRGAKEEISAGDSVLLTSGDLIEPKDTPLNVGGISFSMGIGNRIDCAVLALKLAKAKGRGRFEMFTNTEISNDQT